MKFINGLFGDDGGTHTSHFQFRDWSWARIVASNSWLLNQGVLIHSVLKKKVGMVKTLNYGKMFSMVIVVIE